MDHMCRFENGWIPPRATSGYTKFPCFLCLRDSRAKTEHWIKKDWPVRSELISDSLNVLAPPLVEHSKTVSSFSHKAWHHETVCEGS